MAQLIYSTQALTDQERLADFLRDNEPAAAEVTAELIIEAVQLLGNHPLVGRSVEQGLREMVISRGRTGYVALYSYEEADDIVIVLAIRHQREAGYVTD